MATCYDLVTISDHTLQAKLGGLGSGELPLPAENDRGRDDYRGKTNGPDEDRVLGVHRVDLGLQSLDYICCCHGLN